MGRKGQITLFIIIGAVILISALLLYFLNIDVTSDPGLDYSLREVPLEMRPIDNFIHECLETVAINGLKVIGKQGGYISLEEAGITSSLDPTESEAVAFSKASPLLVPYWFYLASPNTCTTNCKFSYGVPALYKGSGISIEQQLEKYVNDNLGECLGGFDDFKAAGYEINELSPIDTTVKVQDTEVAFLVDYGLRVEKASVGEVDKFMIKVPVRLKDIYHQAVLITQLESQYKFLERNLLNLLVGFSGAETDRLPPMSESEFEFGAGKVWTQTLVKDKVEDVLQVYIPFLQVYGSNNYKPVQVTGRLSRALYNEGMLIPSNSTFKGLSVFFSYLDFWPIYFDLNCDGELCQSESASTNLLMPFGVQRYNFAYDVSFPVMVEIMDPHALNGEGYTFSLFLEGNVRNNAPMDSDFEPLAEVAFIGRSLMCEDQHKNSPELTFNIKDGSTGAGIDGVQVVYTCAQESCHTGSTVAGVMGSKFPICLGGIVSFIKEDYLSYHQRLSTHKQIPQSYSVVLEPYRYLDFEIRKKEVEKTNDGWKLNPNQKALDSDELAVVILTRKGSANEDEFSTIMEYDGLTGNNEKIKLLPGDYEIEIRLFKEESLIIPEETRKEGTLVKTEYTIPRIEFDDTIPSGGLKINHTFTRGELRAGKIIFYSASPDILGIPESERKIEDLDQMGKVEEYSSMYKDQLIPVFE